MGEGFDFLVRKKKIKSEVLAGRLKKEGDKREKGEAVRVEKGW